jgi:hypothetical protein
MCWWAGEGKIADRKRALRISRKKNGKINPNQHFADSNKGSDGDHYPRHKRPNKSSLPNIHKIAIQLLICSHDLINI